MTNDLNLKLLNTLDNLSNNNIKLEEQLFSFSSKEEQELYNELLEQQKEMLKEIKNLDIQEETLNQKEDQIIKKEKELNKKEDEIKEKEILIQEKERLKKEQEENEEKREKILARKKQIKNIVENTLQQPQNVEPKELFAKMWNLKNYSRIFPNWEKH